MRIIDELLKNFDQDMEAARELSDHKGRREFIQKRKILISKLKQEILKAILNSSQWPEYDKNSNTSQWIIVNQCENRLTEILND